MSSNEELESIRKRKMLELQRQLSEEETHTEQQKLLEEQKQALLRRIMTPKARERLNRIRMVKSQFVEQLEIQLLQIAQSGRVRFPITDQQLKDMLAKLQPRKRKFKIERI